MSDFALLMTVLTICLLLEKLDNWLKRRREVRRRENELMAAILRRWAEHDPR